MEKNTLSRFEAIQADVYQNALREIKAGKKTSHWMWFIFPQIQGLGSSDMAKYYAIQNKSEAEHYLSDAVLGKRLVEISRELLKLPTGTAEEIFGYTDSLKLRSSMTLFSLLDKTDPVFQQVLDKYFGGRPDAKTIALLNR